MNAGNIPNVLSRLSSLQILDLYNNNLSGKSYDAISDAAAAQIMIRAGNIPSELSKLSSLQELNLNNNKLSGES